MWYSVKIKETAASIGFSRYPEQSKNFIKEQLARELSRKLIEAMEDEIEGEIDLNGNVEYRLDLHLFTKNELDEYVKFVKTIDDNEENVQ